MLKNKNDIKSIVYMALTTGVFFSLWNFGYTLPTWLFVPAYIIFLFFSVAVAVMAHNHNHLPMWKNKYMNIITDNWLTIFYGFPAFAWIPTHNSNHHKYVNKEPDYTKTYRYTERNNLFTLLTYPSISGIFQQSKVSAFWWGTLSKNKEKFFWYTLQFVVLIVWIAAFMILDWRKALLYVVVPQQFSLFSVLLFNYVQHVHADEETKYNSSRNFMGILNSMLFNNGMHTIHHIHPSLHWSELPEEHEKIKHLIDDSLIEKNGFWAYIIRSYVVGLFIPKYRTSSMRVARIKSGKSVGE